MSDSVATRAFAEARTLLDGLEVEFPRSAPPLELRLVEAPARAPGTATRPYRLGSVPVPAPTPVLTTGPTLNAARAALAASRTTTRALVEAALGVAADTAALGTVVAIDPDAALAEADRLDAERAAGQSRGPLHGIPVTVKDIIDVAGLPTRAGSLAYDDLPELDAAAVARLRGAGALILAKVATHEFALGVVTPQCRNPHDPERISGGSSGGSAIAVATGVGLASLGTDTRASLRVPASLCGVVGFKPTFGRVPSPGIVPLSWTIDHLGPITRTVEDAAVMLNVLADRPFLEIPGDDVRPGGVLGLVPEVFEDADPDVARRCEEALGVLERLGYELVELAGPSLADLEVSNALGLLVSRSEAAAYHRSRGADLELCIPEVRDQLTAALGISAVDYLDAQRQRDWLSARVVGEFARCDVVVAPTTPVVAPRYPDYERFLLRLSRNTIIWSLVGAPAVSLPCGAGSGGLPVGLQLAARPGGEQMLVTVGIALERALGAPR